MKNGRGVVGRRVIYRGAKGVVEWVQGNLLSLKMPRCSVWPVKRSAVKFVRGDYRAAK